MTSRPAGWQPPKWPRTTGMAKEGDKLLQSGAQQHPGSLGSAVVAKGSPGPGGGRFTKMLLSPWPWPCRNALFPRSGEGLHGFSLELDGDFSISQRLDLQERCASHNASAAPETHCPGI